MSNQGYCSTHKETPTRLRCSNCNEYICPKCAIESAVGYRCPDCGKRNISHIEKISDKDYIRAFMSALLVGSVVGFIWQFFNNFGMFISLAVAYICGFCIARSITKIIGYKIGRKVQILAGVITLISLVLNPISILLNLSAGYGLFHLLILFTFTYLGDIIGLLAVIIAIWASIRHFKF